MDVNKQTATQNKKPLFINFKPVSQLRPVNRVKEQLQTYPSGRSVQFPPFRQGPDSQPVIP